MTARGLRFCQGAVLDSPCHSASHVAMNKFGRSACVLRDWLSRVDEPDVVQTVGSVQGGAHWLRVASSVGRKADKYCPKPHKLWDL